MCGSIEITFILNNTKHTCFSMRHTVHSLPLILFALRTMLRTVSMLAACFGCCCCCWSRRFTRANALLCGIETICMYALTILSIFKIANECVNNTRDSLCIDDVWFQSCIYMSDEPAVLLSLYLSAGLVSLSLSVISVIFFSHILRVYSLLCCCTTFTIWRETTRSCVYTSVEMIAKYVKCIFPLTFCF